MLSGRYTYLWLRMLATDELPSTSPCFWTAWERVSRSLTALLASSGGDSSEAKR